MCYTFCLCPALDRVFSGERPSGSVTIRITCIQALDMSVTILGNDTGIYTQVHIVATWTSWVRTSILTLKHVFFFTNYSFLAKNCFDARWTSFGYQRAGFYIRNRPGTSAAEIEGKPWPDELESKMTVIRCWYLLCKLIIHRIKPPYINIQTVGLYLNYKFNNTICRTQCSRLLKLGTLIF